MTNSNLEPDYIKTTTFQPHEDKQLNTDSFGMKIEVYKTGRKLEELLLEIAKRSRKTYCVTSLNSDGQSLIEE